MRPESPAAPRRRPRPARSIGASDRDSPAWHPAGRSTTGIGGDNSKGSAGSFFEGVMTAGLPSDATENAVQANITSVHYALAPANTGLTPGAGVSLRATTACCTGDYLSDGRQRDDLAGDVDEFGHGQGERHVDRARRPADPSCVSFESRTVPGDFIRHQNFQLFRKPDDGSALFHDDATFCPTAGKSGQGTSFMSVNFPTRFIRHFDFTGFIASDGGPNTFDSATLWTDDVSWVVAPPLAP